MANTRKGFFQALLIALAVLLVIAYVHYTRQPRYISFEEGKTEMVPPDKSRLTIEVLGDGMLKVETRVSPPGARINVYVISLRQLEAFDASSIPADADPLTVVPSVAKRMNSSALVLEDIEVEAGKYAIVLEPLPDSVAEGTTVIVDYVLSELN